MCRSGAGGTATDWWGQGITASGAKGVASRPSFPPTGGTGMPSTNQRMERGRAAPTEQRPLACLLIAWRRYNWVTRDSFQLLPAIVPMRLSQVLQAAYPNFVRGTRKSAFTLWLRYGGTSKCAEEHACPHDAITCLLTQSRQHIRSARAVRG